MVVQTLFSNCHEEPVTRVCNYSDKPHIFRANSFLGLAEPVPISRTGRNTVDFHLANNDGLDVSVSSDWSSVPESSDL